MDRKRLQEKRLLTKAAKIGVGRRLMNELEAKIGRENLLEQLSGEERQELDEIENFSNLFLANDLGLEPGLSQENLETGLENPDGTGFNNNFVFPVENGGHTESEKAELYSNAADFLGRNVDRFEGLYASVVQNIDHGETTYNIEIDGDDIVDSIEQDLRVKLDEDYSEELIESIGDEVEGYLQRMESTLEDIEGNTEELLDGQNEIKSMIRDVDEYDFTDEEAAMIAGHLSRQIDTSATAYVDQDDLEAAFNNSNIDPELSLDSNDYDEIANRVAAQIDQGQSGEKRRGFLKKVLAGGAALTGAGLLYKGSQNSGREISVASEHVGEPPGNYNISAVDDETVNSFIHEMESKGAYSNAFGKVDAEVGDGDIDIGFSHEENRIDFYDNGEIISSVEMSEDRYETAISEWKEMN